MELYIDLNFIKNLIRKQLTNLFIYYPLEDDPALDSALDTTIQRCKKCFSAISNKYYKKNGQPCFNPFHSGQYSTFLYYLSNSVWTKDAQNRSLADRIYYLNKALNGLDLYYEISMPDIFLIEHPVGSVLGRALYGNYFTFYQNCTVGSNKNVFPQFGENICLMSGAKVVGSCKIGDHVILSANTYVKDQDIPSCSIVFGSSPNLTLKQKTKRYFIDQMQTRFVVPSYLSDIL